VRFCRRFIDSAFHSGLQLEFVMNHSAKSTLVASREDHVCFGSSWLREQPHGHFHVLKHFDFILSVVTYFVVDVCFSTWATYQNAKDCPGSCEWKIGYVFGVLLNFYTDKYLPVFRSVRWPVDIIAGKSLLLGTLLRFSETKIVSVVCEQLPGYYHFHFLQSNCTVGTLMIRYTV